MHSGIRDRHRNVNSRLYVSILFFTCRHQNAVSSRRYHFGWSVCTQIVMSVASVSEWIGKVHFAYSKWPTLVILAHTMWYLTFKNIQVFHLWLLVKLFYPLMAQYQYTIFLPIDDIDQEFLLSKVMQRTECVEPIILWYDFRHHHHH